MASTPLQYSITIEEIDDMVSATYMKKSSFVRTSVRSLIFENLIAEIGDRRGLICLVRAVDPMTFQPRWGFRLKENDKFGPENDWAFDDEEFDNTINRMINRFREINAE
jgi:hypothetical protein